MPPLQKQAHPVLDLQPKVRTASRADVHASGPHAAPRTVGGCDRAHVQVYGPASLYSPEDCGSDHKSSSLAPFLCLGRHKETGTSCFRLTLTFLIFFSPQIIQPLLELDQNRSKLKLYIGHLTALCHDRDPLILQGLTPPASYNLDDDQAAWENELQKMTQEQVSLSSELWRHPHKIQLLFRLTQ